MVIAKSSPLEGGGRLVRVSCRRPMSESEARTDQSATSVSGLLHLNEPASAGPGDGSLGCRADISSLVPPTT
jgi:hypothetical protein